MVTRGKAGELDRRITLQRASISFDEFNEPVETWFNLATVWASAHDASAFERLKAQEVEADITTRFVIRPFPTLDAKDRIRWQDKIYNIVGRREVQGTRGALLEIDAVARQETPAGASGFVHFDSFTGDLLALTDPGYTSEQGTGYTAVLSPVAGQLLIRDGNGFLRPDVDVVNEQILYVANSAPVGVNARAFLTVGEPGSGTDRAGQLLGYDPMTGNGYGALFNDANLRLYRLDANVVTLIGNAADVTAPDDTIELRRTVTEIALFKNGVLAVSTIDATHTHIGQCGLFGGAFVGGNHDWNALKTFSSFWVQDGA